MAGKGFYVKEPNRERLREERLRQIEAKMMDVIRECKELGVPLEELSSIWQALYENER